MTALSVLVSQFLDESFRLDPLEATNAGRHEHDHRWPDWSDAGIRERLDWGAGWIARLEGIPADQLSADDAIDRDRLLAVLGDERAEADLAEDTWDPLTWIYRLGDGLFTLLARDFAPPAARLASFAGRLEGIPGVIGAASQRIGSQSETTVSRFHTEIALVNLAGIVDLVDEGLALAEANATDSSVAALRPRLDAAAEAARASLEAFRTHLRHDILPAADGEGRLGRERFEARLRRTFTDETISSDAILAEAESQYADVRAEMVRLARDLWPAWRGAEPMPRDEGAIVRGVLDAIAADHPAADGLLDACREELRRIEAFCRERSVIGLADEPLQIQWTPRFLRPFAGAMLHSPGRFDRGQKAFFSITPPAEDWSPERVESMLREHHRRQLTLLTIHEAVPGHYLEGVYTNRVPSLVRSVYGDGVFAEGWAVYVTHVMLDLGFDADDPALWLAHWKYYLRAIVNTIIDVRIHVHGMTRAEAIELMVEGAFQEESEAHGKYDRARLSSTQLSTYFIGSMGFWEIEAEARRRAATASVGAGAAAAIRPGGILGAYGSTPGFDYRAHLESVIAHGSLPLPLLRRALFGTTAG
ncbi:MAG TPA: DUF885 domain-containing protein [Candidatus Limnocylindrales bacterium]|nr:DUF885 domain-containing protein [Candidatus Limnocylindrales bacterium]